MLNTNEPKSCNEITPSQHSRFWSVGLLIPVLFLLPNCGSRDDVEGDKASAGQALASFTAGTYTIADSASFASTAATIIGPGRHPKSCMH